MKKGQALLTFVVLISIAMMIISFVITMVSANSIAATVGQQSMLLRQAAENGIENALLRLLRDPNYSGETISASINTYETEIIVTGNDTDKTIVSTAVFQNYQQKIKAKINYTDNIMTVIYWQDIYE